MLASQVDTRLARLDQTTNMLLCSPSRFDTRLARLEWPLLELPSLPYLAAVAAWHETAADWTVGTAADALCPKVSCDDHN